MAHASAQRKKRNRILIAKYILAAVLIAFAVLPFIWIVSTSFNAAKSLLGAHLIPAKVTVNNYVELLTSKVFHFNRWLINSLKVSFISTAIIVLLTALSAYVLSRFRFGTRKGIMLGIMVLNVFPGILSMIAIYSMFQDIGYHVPWFGLNTHTGLIALYVAGEMSVNILMVKAYNDTIPVEIDESALVEGASYWQTFWRVIFPMIKPIIITCTILSFMKTYGDFIIANIFLKGNEKITVMVGIFQFTQQRFDTDWGIVMAGTVIAALPALIVFFISQKYIITGLTSGAVKQ